MGGGGGGAWYDSMPQTQHICLHSITQANYNYDYTLQLPGAQRHCRNVEL